MQPVVVVRTVQLVRPNDTCRRSRLLPSTFTASLLGRALAELGARACPGVSVRDRKRRSRPFALALRAPLGASDLQARRCGKALRTGQVRDTRASCQRSLPNAGGCAAACVVHLVAETGASRAVGRQRGRVCRACRPACAAFCCRARSVMCLSSIGRTAYTQLASRGCVRTPESGSTRR